MAIRVNKETRAGSFLLSLAALLLRALLGLLGRSWRIEVVAGEEVLARLLREKRPHILSCWHNRSFAAAFFLRRYLLKQGFDITLLASQSRDGELVTRTVGGWGIHTVRGSASRGGREAMRGIYRAIKDRASSPLVIPDGPKGPLYSFKAGALVLAQLSGAPILLMGFAARSAWRLKSWDRLIVPRPFTRVVVVLGEPEVVPAELPGDALETERQRLETRLAELTRAAEAAAAE